MKVFMTTLGTWGDVHPFILMAKKLQKENHDVVILTNSQFKNQIENEGIKYHSVSAEEDLNGALDYLVNNALVWEDEHKKKNLLQQVIDNNSDIFLKPAKEIDRYITDNYEEGNTFIITHVLCFGTRYVQDKLDIPGVSVTLTPFYIRSKEAPPKQAMIPSFLPDSIHFKFERWFNDKVLYKKMFEQFNEFDMTPYADYNNRICKEGLVCFCPDFFVNKPSDWPDQTYMVGFPTKEDTSLTDDNMEIINYAKNSSKAPLLFSLGAKQRIDMKIFWQCVELCNEMNRSGIFLGMEEDKLEGEKVGDNIKLVKFLPIQHIVDYCDCVIYHGGIGTCIEVMRKGKPHIILPEFPEHFDTARRLNKLGIGTFVSRNSFNAKKVAKTINGYINNDEVSKSCSKYVDILNNSKDAMDEFYNSIKKYLTK